MNDNNNHAESIAQLAKAMDNLADAINNFTRFAQTAREENPEWAKMPDAIVELNRRLLTLCTRL